MTSSKSNLISFSLDYFIISSFNLYLFQLLGSIFSFNFCDRFTQFHERSFHSSWKIGGNVFLRNPKPRFPEKDPFAAKSKLLNSGFRSSWHCLDILWLQFYMRAFLLRLFILSTLSTGCVKGKTVAIGNPNVGKHFWKNTLASDASSQVQLT